MTSLREIEIVPVTEEQAIEVYTGKGMEVFLDSIEAEVAKFPREIETEKQRKAVKSNAYRIARLKTTVDDFGKDLVADAKAKVKVVDKQRKIVRDFLDDLKDNYKSPLDELEAKELAEAEAEREKERDRILKEAEEALEKQKKAEAELAEMKKVLQDKEDAEQAKLNEERNAIEQEERENQIKEEATARAEHLAQQAVDKAQQDARDAEERERQAVVKAEEDKKKAVADALEDQEKKAQLTFENGSKISFTKSQSGGSKFVGANESILHQDETEEQAEAHYKIINNEVLDDLIALGFPVSAGKDLIKAIVTGKIRHVELNY